MNQYGEHKFDKAWSRELTMVAKNGWLLSGMCPSDISAFSASADWLVGSRTALSGHDLLHFYIAGFLKLPHAVEAWMSCMREPRRFRWRPRRDGGPAEISSPKSAAEFASCSCELAAALSGVQAHWEHDQLSTGQQNINLGPHAFFRRMGMLESRGEDTVKISIHLGKKGSLVNVFRNDDKWEDLVAVVDAFNDQHPGGLALPQDAAGTHEFVKVVAQFLQSFPKSFGHGQGGKDDSATRYVFKHILRKIIRWAQSRTPHAILLWRSWTIDEITTVTPDKNNLLSALPPDMPADKAQNIFGVDAFMLSCWACLFHGVQEKNFAAFEEASLRAKMQQLVQELKKKHGQEPNLNTLGQEYLKKC
jgi:hypothetical protein